MNRTTKALAIAVTVNVLFTIGMLWATDALSLPADVAFAIGMVGGGVFVLAIALITGVRKWGD